MPWTADQILALAPDPASAKSGRELSSAGKWVTLGADDQSLWGECKGSAATPYQTRVDLSEPAFKCSCPSRKFPCKHGLGLFLLFADRPASFKDRTAPAWVSEWLAARRAKAEKKTVQKGEEAAEESDPDIEAKRGAEQAKRAGKREDNVAAGIDDLTRWMHDVVGRGLATLRTEGCGFFEAPAKRLIDAQAPGLARLVRRMGDLAAAGDGREEKIFERLASLNLLIEGWKRRESLPTATAADVRALVGFNQSQEELLQQPGVRDCWVVMGRRLYEEDRLRVQRTWLWGEKTRRPALCLHFAAFTQKLDVSLVPGTVIDAELVFFPSALPLRALVKERFGDATQAAGMPGHPTIDAAVAEYARAIAVFPWLEEFPAAFESVVPVCVDGNWLLRDAVGAVLPLTPGEDNWRLAAACGGAAMTVFGEFDGERLLPLAGRAEGRHVRFRAFAGELETATA